MAGRYILLIAFQQNRKRLEGKSSLNQLKVESFFINNIIKIILFENKNI